MSNNITVKRFKYVLDWFEIKDYEIDLDIYPKFELQCRGNECDWYLIPYKVGEKGYLEPDHLPTINIRQPWVFVHNHGHRILKYSTNNVWGFTKQMQWLMDNTIKYKNRQESCDE